LEGSDWPALTIAGTSLPPAEVEHIFTNYATAHSATIRYYDFGEGTETVPNAVTLSDIGRMVLMDPRLSGSDAAHLLDRGNAVDARWERFDADADVVDADPAQPGSNSLWREMLAQYEMLRKSGVREAKITKPLHLKRPRPFPIVDSRVTSIYGRGDRWRMLRHDVVANHEALAHLRRVSATAQMPEVQHLHALTDLRLIDIAAWTLGS
jgi:hypothetical protein